MNSPVILACGHMRGEHDCGGVTCRYLPQYRATKVADQPDKLLDAVYRITKHRCDESELRYITKAAKVADQPVGLSLGVRMAYERYCTEHGEKDDPFDWHVWQYAWDAAIATKRNLINLKESTMFTDEQIKHMRDRFLGWKIPTDKFYPDCGISFKRTFNEHTAHPCKYEPSGTSVFDAEVAEQMIRYVLEGLPKRESGELRENIRMMYRVAEMSAGIMRDKRRTGGWEGSEKVARQFDRIAERGRKALSQIEGGKL